MILHTLLLVEWRIRQRADPESLETEGQDPIQERGDRKAPFKRPFQCFSYNLFQHSPEKGEGGGGRGVVGPLP